MRVGMGLLLKGQKSETFEFIRFVGETNALSGSELFRRGVIRALSASPTVCVS